jgi:hypothetical protein
MNSMVSVWTDHELAVAREVFERAHGRAVQTLIAAVQSQADQLDSVEALWQLHDFLSIQRHRIEGNFDFRLEGILFVFAGLVKDGLLEPAELQDLDDDKRGKIMAMARF